MNLDLQSAVTIILNMLALVTVRTASVLGLLLLLLSLLWQL